MFECRILGTKKKWGLKWSFKCQNWSLWLFFFTNFPQSNKNWANQDIGVKTSDQDFNHIFHLNGFKVLRLNISLCHNAVNHVHKGHMSVWFSAQCVGLQYVMMSETAKPHCVHTKWDHQKQHMGCLFLHTYQQVCSLKTWYPSENYWDICRIFVPQHLFFLILWNWRGVSVYFFITFLHFVCFRDSVSSLMTTRSSAHLFFFTSSFCFTCFGSLFLINMDELAHNFLSKPLLPSIKIFVKPTLSI